MNPKQDPVYQQAHRARIRMLFSHVPVGATIAAAFAVLVGVLLLPNMPGQDKWAWLWLKCLWELPIIALACWHARSDEARQMRLYRLYLALIVLDGTIWGSIGWWLVPGDRVDLAAVAVACMLGVASMGTFMLNLDAKAARLFMLPMLLPNALMLLTHYGPMGLFGGVSLFAFIAILFKETSRAESRIDELLTLRFLTERVSQERAEALELVQHHSEAKSRFLATMSHEMRTPLHGMLGLARLLRDDEARPEAQQRLHLIERSGEHLLSVINDVLDTSRIESDRVHIDNQPFDLMAVIEDVAGVTRVPAEAKGLQLDIETTLQGPLHVMGDAARVRQVLHNLLGNAVKFTDRGRICLRVVRPVGSALLAVSVEDSGIGIPPEELPHIFEAFHQVENTAERRHGGTGLGLMISQKLCRAMGGDLVCESVPGQGSTFTALLALSEVPAAAPWRDAAADEPAMSDGAAVPEGSLARVLLVDDNPVNAMVAEASLRQFGADVSVVGDGLAALAWLQHHEADLVLLDCQMPGLDGFEVTRRLRALEATTGRPRLPVVALTAEAGPEARARCLAAGMDDHLAKPFHRHELAQLLRRHLGRHAWAQGEHAPAEHGDDGGLPDEGARDFVNGLLRHAL
ncbi:ATP-binding protein [Aquabacterium sp.]|uniref:ATP-binding protein n=1 Tax=Aquabacterium sp. TaxID=1872578 RepID=UPI0035B1643D